MTEYGRGAGREPWHPEDPLYGDQGWAGQQAAQGQGPYGGQPQHYQQEPQHPQPQQPYYDGGQQQQPQQHGHPGRPQPYNDQQRYGHGHNGGWDTGAHQQQEPVPYGMNPAADPYAAQQPAYGGEGPDYYAAPEAYPPPQPPNQRRAAPEPDQAPEWEPETEAEEQHPFFTGGDDRDDDAHDDDPRQSRGGRGGRGGDRRGGKSKKKKSRNGTACLFVTVVLVGGMSGIGYFGYQFYQDQFGAPEDYAGTGSGPATQVEIPQGAGGYEIGRILQKEGVVKSQGAFVAAQTRNPQGKNIQAGVYTLKKAMSADNAVAEMLKPSSRNALIIPEGQRNAWVYKEIDKRLEVKAGTTEDIAQKEAKNLGLPEWATDHADLKDPLEGFLFPASYPVAKSAKPADVLKKMVARSNAEYEKLDLETNSKSLGLKGPWELLTVASLVQVEGKTDDDFRRMGEVVYNRLKPTNTETNQLLQFDSAFNYLNGESEIEISESEINSNQDPYNTYTQKGLPPGPISNPGNEALAAALNPTQDGWMYFVATDGQHKTEFAKTHDDFLKLKEKFNDNQGSE